MDAFYKTKAHKKRILIIKSMLPNLILNAYNEIKMFWEIVTAAESAEGIVGLNYSIKVF